MKKIEAIIQPHKLDEVKGALHGIGVEGITISDVRGHGTTEGSHRNLSRERIQGRPSPQSEDGNGCSRRPRDGRWWRPSPRAARSGKIGDGKIFVSTVDEAIRIRSGEEGETIL